MNKHYHIISKNYHLIEMLRSKTNEQYGKIGSNEYFLERAIDALSVIKISNSFIRSTLQSDEHNEKINAAFHRIENAVLKIEAFLDKSKHQQKNNKKYSNSHQTASIKKRNFRLSELLKMSIPKNLPSQINVNLPKEDLEVYGDFYKLVVVLTNLIENSIDAMKKSGVINIFSRDLNKMIVIEVKDSGPGIPTEIINKVFSSLYSTKPDGNGLGLKMAKTIVESHGGTISVRNNPTTFTIKIPKQN